MALDIKIKSYLIDVGVCVYPFIFTDFLELLGHTTC